MKQINFKKIKGFGLVEILVGLAITGGVLIALTSGALVTYRQVKDNELADHANSIMLMSVEFFKTPVTNTNIEPAKTLSQMTTPGGKYVLRIASNVDLDASQLQINSTNISQSDITPLTTCSTSSPFLVTYSASSQITPTLCNKIIITKDLNGKGYVIESFIAYINSFGKTVTSKIIGYRQVL